MSQRDDGSDEPSRGFKVEDKRRFTTEGEAKNERSERERSGAAGAESPHEGATGTASELTFSSFVIGLASQAFVFLGAMPEQQSGKVVRDLPQAKALIDILSMLSVKTTGNLDEHESRMMEEMLYELRMHYVKELRAVGSEGGRTQ